MIATVSGWEWFILATVTGAFVWAGVIGFIVLWSQANKTAGRQWDQTMAAGPRHWCEKCGSIHSELEGHR